jgi:hypothetical protein
MPLRKSAVAQTALPAAACYHPLLVELLRAQVQWRTLLISPDYCIAVPEAAQQQHTQVKLNFDVRVIFAHD